MISSLFISSAWAVDDSDKGVKHALHPVDFVFCYNDGNRTTYDGDLGLKNVLCRNTIDGMYYYLSISEIRGLAYITNKTFKFNDDIYVTLYLSAEDIGTKEHPYDVHDMYYRNGEEIKKLDISDTSLTRGQRAMFEDYELQRELYHQEEMERYEDEIAHEEASQTYAANRKHSNRGYYVGSNGNYGHYWSY